MTTGRLVAAGAAAVALFLVAGLLLVDRLTSEPASARRAPSPDAARPAGPLTPQDLAAAGPPSNLPPAGLAGVGMPSSFDVDPGPAPPPRGSWEAVAISPRAASLGKVGVALGQELNELHPDLSACFEEDAQARHGTSSVTAVRDTSPQDDVGVTVLVLQLETTNGAIRIVDAPVEARGQASDGLLACAQARLRGRVVEAPGTVGGQRYRLLYTLLP